MERNEAVNKLRQLIGIELHSLAEKYEVTVIGASGHINKGWAGHVFERYLGLPQNSAQSPNFGSWELKSVPLIKLRDGNLRLEQFDFNFVARTSFEQSHLLAKLKKFVHVTRTVGASPLNPSYIHSVTSIEVTNDLYETVKHDYNTIQNCILDLKELIAI